MTKVFLAAGAFWTCLCSVAVAQTQTVDAGKPLVLTTQASDFTLQFEWLPTVGAAPMLTLPNGQQFALQHSRFGKTPGLWQRAYVSYQAARNGQPAILNKLAINDITIQEGQNLTAGAMGGRQTGQPVQLAIQSGSATVRNIGVRPLADRVVANWTGPITYRLVGKDLWSKAEVEAQPAVKTGTLDQLDYNVSYGQSGRFSILYTGKLNVPTAGTYIFDLQQGGGGGLWIDGQEVIKPIYHDLNDPESRQVPLTAGPHEVQVLFTRSWPRPGLGLFVSQPDTRPQPLHANGSLPEVTPIAAVMAQPEPRPTLIRSFVQLPGEVTKRTHALSVGSQTGLHYTLDLNQMALVWAWKGDFADVTQMWYERGEPQLLRPAGVVIHTAPRTALAPLPAATTAWPDSLGTDVLAYKGLFLDKEGNPSAEYTLAGATVRDQVRPMGSGLTRTLTLSGTPTGTLYARLAAGTQVEEVAKGLYAVNDRSYFVRFDPKAAVSVRQSGGQQELIMPVSMKNGSATVSYMIEF
jgi:hypothetical protein